MVGKKPYTHISYAGFSVQVSLDRESDASMPTLDEAVQRARQHTPPFDRKSSGHLDEYDGQEVSGSSS